MDKSAVRDHEETPDTRPEVGEEPEESGERQMGIHARIHAVMADLGPIEKDQKMVVKNKEGRKVGEYDYISHDAVAAHVRPAFIDHGIMVVPTILGSSKDGNRTELKVGIKFINTDDPQDFIEVESVGYGVDNSDKGPGKAYSYAVKYAYLKLLMLNSFDDADAGAVDHDPAVATASAQQAAQQRAVEDLQNWAHTFKAAIENAGTAKEVDQLQAANKQRLMDAPDVTRDYFIEMIELRKQYLGEGE